MRERWRTIVTICFVIVMFVPAARAGDGVPLSSYPMYATPRSSEVTFVVSMGIGASGEDVELSPRTIARTNDPLIVESYLRREVEGGRGAALCSAIASRSVDPGIIAIEIRSVRINVVERVLGQSPPTSSDLVASCPVP